MKVKVVKRRVPKTISVMETKLIPLYTTVDGLDFENQIKAEEHEREIQKAIDYYNQISKYIPLEHLRENYQKYEEHRDEWLETESPENFLAWQYGLKTFLQQKGYKVY